MTPWLNASLAEKGMANLRLAIMTSDAPAVVNQGGRPQTREGILRNRSASPWNALLPRERQFWHGFTWVSKLSNQGKGGFSRCPDVASSRIVIRKEPLKSII